MPAPKGHEPYNKNGEGGRPQEHDLNQIALDLLAWVKKPESLNLNGFCGWHEPPYPPQHLGMWGRQSERFLAILNAVKGILAERREQRLSEGLLHQKAYDLNAKVYDALIKEEWRESISYEIQQKSAASIVQVSPETEKMFVDIMQGITAVHKDKSERK